MPDQETVTIAPARRFDIEFFVPTDWEDEMGFHLAEGMNQALDGVIATRCVGVEDVGYIGVEYIQNDGRRYLQDILMDEMARNTLAAALEKK